MTPTAQGMETLVALAGRCEQATGPDRELDEAIYEVIGAVRPGTCDLYWSSPDGRTRHYAALVPTYTASIDAALALAGERDLMAVWRAVLGALACDGVTRDDIPRLICAAALRARSA